MYKKHSIEERLLTVKKCFEGHSPESVGHQMGIIPHGIFVQNIDEYEKKMRICCVFLATRALLFQGHLHG